MVTTKTPWQKRAKAAGLPQQVLATLTGQHKTTIARQLRGYWQSGIPKHTRSMIIAWEVMTPDQREHWLKLVEGDVDGSVEPAGTDG